MKVTGSLVGWKGRSGGRHPRTGWTFRTWTEKSSRSIDFFLKLNFLENIRGFFVDYNFGQFLIATLLICQMTDELGRITDDFFVKRVGGKVTNSTKLNISFMYSWSIFTGQPIKN